MDALKPEDLALVQRVLGYGTARTYNRHEVARIIEAVRKDSYKRGWSDREDEFLGRCEAILPPGSVPPPSAPVEADRGYIAELAKDAREELEAHREWLIENPEEQDPGPEEIGVHPETLLALIGSHPTPPAVERLVEAAKAVDHVALVVDSAVRRCEGERGQHNVALVKDALAKTRQALASFQEVGR